MQTLAVADPIVCDHDGSEVTVHDCMSGSKPASAIKKQRTRQAVGACFHLLEGHGLGLLVLSLDCLDLSSAVADQHLNEDFIISTLRQPPKVSQSKQIHISREAEDQDSL